MGLDMYLEAKVYIGGEFHFIKEKQLTVSRKMKRFDKEVKKMQATEKGVQALLRNSIIQMYNKAMHDKCLKIYERENLQHMFEEYTALGGNGVVQGLVEKMYELPTSPPNEE